MEAKDAADAMVAPAPVEVDPDGVPVDGLCPEDGIGEEGLDARRGKSMGGDGSHAAIITPDAGLRPVREAPTPSRIAQDRSEGLGEASGWV